MTKGFACLQKVNIVCLFLCLPHNSTITPVFFQPPPPGCAPNAAQMAQMQGHDVVVTQQRGNFLTGGSDGGYTVW